MGMVRSHLRLVPVSIIMAAAALEANASEMFKIFWIICQVS
jgi:hypothetical protein